MNALKLSQIINKCLMITFTMIFFAVASFAAENSLSGIDVKQNTNGEYNIILKLDKKTQVKKVLNNKNKLAVFINSTLPSDAMDIVYDNASSMTNVVVQKKNKNNTFVLFEGNNISNAKMYIKEISTGHIKQVNNNRFNNVFFIADKKLFAISLTSILLMFFLMLLSRPKSQRYNNKSTINTIKNNRTTKVNTLRNKNLAQPINIPSINAGINGSFNSARIYMSIPQELTVNNSYEEEIRKVG